MAWKRKVELSLPRNTETSCIKLSLKTQLYITAQGMDSIRPLSKTIWRPIFLAVYLLRK